MLQQSNNQLQFRGVYSLIKKVLLCFLVVFLWSVSLPESTNAQIQITELSDGTQSVRSLESLRDLDHETWQVIAYRGASNKEKIILRIVGFPGTLRLDHPFSLQVHGGRKDWKLKDITLSNSQLVNDSRAAAAEFLLSPLLMDLKNNKPLRMQLSGSFTELPIPPYVVSEWRTLQETTFVK